MSLARGASPCAGTVAPGLSGGCSCVPGLAPGAFAASCNAVPL